MSAGRKAKKPRGVFGERLRKAREILDLSQEAVACGIGMGQSGYSQWEQGRAGLRPDQIQSVATFLHTTVAELFGEVQPPSEPELNKRKWGKLLEDLGKLPPEEQERIYRALLGLVRR